MDHYADDLYRYKNPAKAKAKLIRFPFGWMFSTIVLLVISIRFWMGDAPFWTLIIFGATLLAFGITFVCRTVRWGVA